MRGYNYGYVGSASSSLNGIATWMVISIIIAIAGGIVAYILFVKRKNTFIGFVGWLHKFLNFKALVIEDVIKLSYIILAIFMTLFSFALIGVSVASFFGLLILGNLILRVVYELSILLIKICQNTSEINMKLKK